MNTRMQVKTGWRRNDMRVENRVRAHNDMHRKNDTQITSERRINIECRSDRVSKRTHRRHSHLTKSLSAAASL